MLTLDQVILILCLVFTDKPKKGTYNGSNYIDSSKDKSPRYFFGVKTVLKAASSDAPGRYEKIIIEIHMKN